MNWFHSLGLTEIILISVFLVFYLLYLIRVIRVAGQVRSSYGLVFIKLFWRTAIFALLIIALLGPGFGKGQDEVKAIGKDIYIAVDLSQSMNAEDIQPSRLEKIKFELKNIVDAFASDRISLIIFSNEAFVQCPLTFDQSAIYLFIETLNTNLVPEAGTDFGAPLALTLRKIEKESGSNRPSSKIIILISDGEDFGEETEQKAEEIKEQGIKLFTLGVGTSEGSRIPMAAGFKKDFDGNDVITQLNSTSLRDLATATGGQYFEINSSRNDVERLINVIVSLEGELQDTRIVDVSTNKYFYFLALALIMITLDILITFKILKL